MPHYHLMLARGVAVLAMLAACKDAGQGVAHFGEWTIGKTTLQDATGRCEPTTFANGRAGVYCFGQRPATIAEQRATVDLYFATNTPDAPLIELQLTIAACKPEPVQGWLRSTLGKPRSFVGSRMTWESRAMLGLADVPTATGKCQLRFFPPSERGEFDQLTAAAPQQQGGRQPQH